MTKTIKHVQNLKDYVISLILKPMHAELIPLNIAA